MSRKKKQADHENHERWLVSYADFITLLFAFFVVMFASSQTDKGKAQQVAEAVRKALEEGSVGPKIAAILGGTTDDAGKGNAMARGPGGTKKGQDQKPAKPPGGEGDSVLYAQLLPTLDSLSRELEIEIRNGKMQIKLEPRGLVISLAQAAFFASGDERIEPAMYPSIEKVARAVRGLPNPVRLEGHTDSVPIHNSRFHSNWELSAARSIAMLDVLSERYGIGRDRLAIAGYAENVPVLPNDSPEGRARNRRVDVVILSRLGAVNEPPPAAPPAVHGP